MTSSNWIAVSSSNFSVKVILPASGCEMTQMCASAKFRRTGYSSIGFSYYRDEDRRAQADELR
jgi:hypothetical protein